MLPGKSDTKWEYLITGDLKHQFKSVPAGLCVSRNMRRFQRIGSSEVKSECITAVYDFFKKYEPILGDDIKAIFG